MPKNQAGAEPVTSKYMYFMSIEKCQYALLALPTHLSSAGQSAQLCQALTSLCFLVDKTETCGIEALIGDYDLESAQRLLPSDRSLQLIQRALRLSAHILRQDSRQVAAQLLGRLQSQNAPCLDSLLAQARAWRDGPWLRPLSASLAPTGGALIRVLIGHTSAVTALVVTPDGRFAISGSLDGSLKIWNIETGIALLTLTGHAGAVNGLAITPDGRYVVSASSDHTLKVWDIEHGAERLTLHGHTDEVACVAISADGRYAISGAGAAVRHTETTLRVWDMRDGRAIHVLHGHTRRITAVGGTIEPACHSRNG